MRNPVKRQLTYLRERAINAYWMARQGRLRQIGVSVLLELRTRMAQIVASLAFTATPLQKAGGSNPCRTGVPSPRPSVRAMPKATAKTLHEDGQVAVTLQAILSEPEQDRAQGCAVERSP